MAVDVYFVSIPRQAVRSEVDQWIAANDTGEIEFITVDERWVAIHGRRNQFVEVSGTACRQGALAHELDLALAMMRDKRDSQPERRRSLDRTGMSWGSEPTP